MKKNLPAIVFCGGLMFAGAAHAHYLWLESAENGARLYFGEAEMLLKEKSPGKLDNFKSPQAFIQDPATGKTVAVAPARAAQYFAITSDKRPASFLAMDESLEVRDLTKHDLGFAKSNYYARYGQASGGAASMLALDLQSRGTDAFVVMYRGQPLKGAKVEVIAPNTWMQENKTDSQGLVSINTPWRGQYVVHVLHVDKTPGQHGGQRYDSLRNHFTYTFSKTDGADPGPAVAPKHSED